MQQPRMHALDGARGVAAFCILLFHVLGSRIAAFSHLYIAVDFFFVLSGFVLAPAVARVSNITEARSFLISRFVRIFPMVLAIICFTCVYDFTIIVKHWFFEQPPTSPIILNIRTLVASALMLQILYKPAVLVNYPIWSLSAEWIVNIVVALTKIFTSKSRHLSLLIGAGLIVLSGAHESELINQLGRALWGFSFGLSAFAIRHRYAKKYRETIFVSALLVPLYIITPILGEYHSLISIFPFTACILILSQIRTSTKVSHLFTLAGRYSYGFYLWHFPMLSLSNFVLNQIRVDPTSPSRVILELALTASLSILATKVSLTFFEEPIRRYWRRKSQLI
jgi:peptidoglycan/LPS O-acetylase OafA/YrhL